VEKSLILATGGSALEKRAEKNMLRDKGRIYREVFEKAPDGIIVVDSSGQIALVNEETERMFGYSKDDLTGTTVEELVRRAIHP
jgi:protein-histidine pros-kinase